jgi:hypothetical protein
MGARLAEPRRTGMTLSGFRNACQQRSFMNTELRRRTDEVLSRLTQLKDSL